MNNVDISNTLAVDTQGLASLKLAAQNQSPQALKAVAHQFESMFVSMMLKSMRDATPQDGIMDNNETRLYTSMLDEQLSQSLANKGIGLADVLMHQLSANHSLANHSLANQVSGQLSSGRPSSGQMLPGHLAPSSFEANKTTGHDASMTMEDALSGQSQSSGRQQKNRLESPVVDKARIFKSALGAHAEAAGRATGIPSLFILGQAALESHWGANEVVSVTGVRSHNLFGIKATADWHGKTVQAVTTEYSHGVAHKKIATFRAYDSYAQSFADYVHFLQHNPRYQHVLAHAASATDFAHGLQRAGYATDPHYASKLVQVIEQVGLA